MSLDMCREQGRDQAWPVAAGSTFGLARCSHRRFYLALNLRAGRLWPSSILTALLHVKNEISSQLSTHAPRSFTSLIMQLSERGVSATIYLDSFHNDGAIS
jgi:hypothetical protein